MFPLAGVAAGGPRGRGPPMNRLARPSKRAKNCYSLALGFRCGVPPFTTARFRNDTTTPGARLPALNIGGPYCQHVAAPAVVPAHEVGLDGVLPKQHRHRVVNVNGRNIAVRLHAL
ncbi:MAG: hypothetical protein WB755_09170 [Terriglobales bacterium]